MNTLWTRSWRAASSLPRATSRAAQAVFQQQQARLASVLVVADPLAADGHLSVATQSAVTAATTWLDARDDDAPHHCVLLTMGVTPPSSRALPAGVTAHTHAVTTTPNYVVETAAAAIVQAASTGGSTAKPDLVVGAATKWGSSVLPRAAALLQVSPVPDVVAILDARTYRVSPGRMAAGTGTLLCVCVVILTRSLLLSFFWSVGGAGYN
jgi:electron transfer flavoprotein alpha subunit